MQQEANQLPAYIARPPPAPYEAAYGYEQQRPYPPPPATRYNQPPPPQQYREMPPPSRTRPTYDTRVMQPPPPQPPVTREQTYHDYRPTPRRSHPTATSWTNRTASESYREEGEGNVFDNDVASSTFSSPHSVPASRPPPLAPSPMPSRVAASYLVEKQRPSPAPTRTPVNDMGSESAMPQLGAEPTQPAPQSNDNGFNTAHIKIDRKKRSRDETEGDMEEAAMHQAPPHRVLMTEDQKEHMWKLEMAKRNKRTPDDVDRELHAQWKDVHGLKVEEMKDLDRLVGSQRFKPVESTVTRLNYMIQTYKEEQNASTRDIASAFYKSGMKYVWFTPQRTLFYGSEKMYLESHRANSAADVINRLPDDDQPIPPTSRTENRLTRTVSRK